MRFLGFMLRHVLKRAKRSHREFERCLLPVRASSNPLASKVTSTLKVQGHKEGQNTGERGIARRLVLVDVLPSITNTINCVIPKIRDYAVDRVGNRGQDIY